MFIGASAESWVINNGSRNPGHEGCSTDLSLSSVQRSLHRHPVAPIPLLQLLHVQQQVLHKLEWPNHSLYHTDMQSNSDSGQCMSAGYECSEHGNGAVGNVFPAAVE